MGRSEKVNESSSVYWSNGPKTIVCDDVLGYLKDLTQNLQIKKYQGNTCKLVNLKKMEENLAAIYLSHSRKRLI